MAIFRGLDRLLALTVLAGTLAGCTGSSAGIETTPLPDGIVAHIDQSRVERKGREVFLRVENGTRHVITVEGFTLRSPRLETVRWTGDERIGPTYEADLELDLPTGRCGGDIDAQVTLTYRVGDSGPRRSVTAADDPYGAAALFADRDCAQTTLTDAAELEVGEPEVVGAGRASVLRLPVTMTPTGRGSGVSFAGFGSTVLFRQADGSPTDVDVSLDADAPATTQVMAVVPARCDPHALAEDKVGTLFGVGVHAPGLADNASFFLPLTKAQRSAFFAFFRSHCGLD